MNSIIESFRGKKRYYRIWNKLYRLSLIGMNIGCGAGVEVSGELNVMKYVKENSKKNDIVIFDVGANVGDYTKSVLKFFGSLKTTVHCFEPAEHTYKTLQSNIVASNTILNNFGLSDSITESTLYYDAEDSGFASLYNRQLDYFGIELTKKETVKLDTLDNYCANKNIEFIDFLKMDIEGNELNALKGATKMLSEKKIGTIQLEFGGCNLDSRTYLRDFWNLLNKDYIFYRVLKDALVPIEQYTEQIENFGCANYFFALK